MRGARNRRRKRTEEEGEEEANSIAQKECARVTTGYSIDEDESGTISRGVDDHIIDVRAHITGTVSSVRNTE